MVKREAEVKSRKPVEKLDCCRRRNQACDLSQRDQCGQKFGNAHAPRALQAVGFQPAATYRDGEHVLINSLEQTVWSPTMVTSQELWRKDLYYTARATPEIRFGRACEVMPECEIQKPMKTEPQRVPGSFFLSTPRGGRWKRPARSKLSTSRRAMTRAVGTQGRPTGLQCTRSSVRRLQAKTPLVSSRRERWTSGAVRSLLWAAQTSAKERSSATLSKPTGLDGAADNATTSGGHASGCACVVTDVFRNIHLYEHSGEGDSERDVLGERINWEMTSFKPLRRLSLGPRGPELSVVFHGGRYGLHAPQDAFYELLLRGRTGCRGRLSQRLRDPGGASS
ncbi:hypothetical protein HPB52_025083 [Rhipicephalus sanguineus]|uniref:Uncharacterized protein n=1 Tax=Rhipicephalus sanguineus TaxID=34632 RepID=A0A9D4TDI2_RHISA|nr:hypothetical protein HPB52_025083 [Rhipicephalus sanguineus]